MCQYIVVVQPMGVACTCALGVQGKSVCLHLAKRFSALEQHINSSTDDYCAPASAVAPAVGTAPAAYATADAAHEAGAAATVASTPAKAAE